MKFSYQFSNLLGCPYRNGNVEFLPNGDALAAPAGNLLTVYDLKRNTSRTLPFQTSFNISRIAFSPNGYLAMAANDNNDLLSVSMVSRSILRTYHLSAPVHDIKWSPDGKLVAVAKGTELIIYCAPNCVKDVNPFHAVRILRGPYDDVTCLCWAPNSSAVVAGSRDGTSRVYSCDGETDSEQKDIDSFRIANLAWSRKNVRTCSLGGASGSVVAVFFEGHHNELIVKVDDELLMNVYVVTANGQVFVWKKDSANNEMETEEGAVLQSLVYHRTSRFSYKGSTRSPGGTGFSDGSLFIHEMPSFQLIHTLNVSEHPLSCIGFNSSGEWISIASQQLGQIAVWEWRSEMFVMKQQGHFHATTAVAVSPDGRSLASGGSDSKLKLWDMASGHCYVTFGENVAGIVGICWTQSGKAVISASLDGTVRAFDTTRYRNFRTYATPKATQLSCVAVDDSGEMVAAGATDMFEIFVWSLPTGQLLDSLTGHEAPISSVLFLPMPRSGVLVSSSWDSSVRMWSVTDGSSEGSRESLALSSDALAVAARPDGQYVAAATLDCQIAIVETESWRHVGTIEAKSDVGRGRSVDDLITAKQKASAAGQYFSALRYSPDGEFLLAAGHSRFICIYSVKVPGEEMLVRRFQISMNLSLDANQELISRRHMSEMGYLNRREAADDDSIPLPGVSRNDLSVRKHKHAIRVSSIDFNPTGDSFVAASSEGLLVYSVNTDSTFDPVDLDVDMTAENAEKLAKDGDLLRAILIGLKLRNRQLVSKSVEQVRESDIGIVVSRLPSALVADFIVFVASKIEETEDNGKQQLELELYLRWADAILLANASQFTSYQSMAASTGKVAPALVLLQRAVSSRVRPLGQICDYIKYVSSYASEVKS